MSGFTRHSYLIIPNGFDAYDDSLILENLILDIDIMFDETAARHR